MRKRFLRHIFRPKFVVVVVIKQQITERFAEKQANNHVVDTSAGSYIGAGVVGTDTREFFTQSHNAQQVGFSDTRSLSFTFTSGRRENTEIHCAGGRGRFVQPAT